MSKLDFIINRFASKVGTPKWGSLAYQNGAITKHKDQVKALLLEAIGEAEDRPTKTVKSMVDGRMTYAVGTSAAMVYARNQLRSELRDRVKAL